MTAGLAPVDQVTTPGFSPGSLVAVRGREWVVLPGSSDDFLLARPLGGTDDDIAGILVCVEKPQPARFAPPSPDDLGDQLAAGLLRTALRVGFRATAGPFRSLASLAVEPRPYQLVPLLLALRQSVVRLLIADDVGIGKTIEASLIAAELLASGEARGLSVLCSPALAEQWQEELRTKFAIDAELVLAGTAKRLERSTVGGESVFSRFPFTVVSTDFIKSPTRRHEYLQECPDLVIVDEAHTCVADDNTTGGKSRQQRYDLVRELAADRTRHLLLVTATPHSGKDATFRNLLGLLDPTLATIDLDQAAGRELLAGHLVQRRRADIRRYLDEDTPFPTDRLTKEVAYALTPEYHDLFDRVLAHARELVRDRGDGVVRQRVRWWSALALLRALASSPRAAAQTLRNRAANASAASFEEADRLGRAVVFDGADDEAVEAVDTAPGADPETGESDTEPRRRLRSLARAADALAGPLDAKLTAVTKVVTQLLADGYDPIVFCRFIETAEYVGEHLQAKLRKSSSVGVVTGTLLVSESPPAAFPTRRAFLIRNRLIAALTTGTVVVEAALRSGALNTASWANGCLRVVMAVPGPVTSPLSAGTHRLVRDAEAVLVSDAAEVAATVSAEAGPAHAQSAEVGSAEVGVPSPGHEPLPGLALDRAGDPRTGLDEDSAAVLDVLAPLRPTGLAAVLAGTGRSPAAALAALGRLASGGVVESVDGGWRLSAATRAWVRRNAKGPR